MERFTGRGELVPVEVVASTPEGLVAAVHNAARAIRTAQPPIPGLVSVAGLHQLVPDPAVVPGRLARIAAFDSAGALDAFDQALDDSVFEPSAYAGYRRFLVSVLGAAKVPTVSDLMDYPEVAQRLFARDTANALPGAPVRTILLVTMDKPLADREQRAAAIGALVAAAERQPGVTVAGLAAVSEELQAAVQTGLPISVAVSVGLVLIWLLIVFRRPVDVLLALIPLVFAGGATVMFMIATKQNFNPINSVAIPLLNGIAVDAGVFLVAASREFGSTREKLVRHLRFTTHAVILAAATTLTAFASLCFGHTPAIGSLGMVASVGITASFFGAMLVLMPILILRAKPANPSNPTNLSNLSNLSNPSNPSAAGAESTVASV